MGMNRKYKVPPNLWPWLFLLATVVGLLNTPIMKERRAEYKLRRQFEQALAAFDGEETKFTITYETNCGRVAFYQRSSDQLTPKQRQAIEDYVHTLRYKRQHLDEEGNGTGGPVGGSIYPFTIHCPQRKCSMPVVTAGLKRKTEKGCCGFLEILMFTGSQSLIFSPPVTGRKR